MRSEQIDNFPEYMVNYAYYGKDEAGELTDEDIRNYEEWRERNGYEEFLSIDGEHYFSSHPAFGLPCEVIPVSFSVVENVQNSRKAVKSSRESVPVDDITDIIEYYCGLYEETGELNKIQIDDLKDAVKQLRVLSPSNSAQFISWATQVLNKCGVNTEQIYNSRRPIKSSDADRTYEEYKGNLFDVDKRTKWFDDNKINNMIIGFFGKDKLKQFYNLAAGADVSTDGYCIKLIYPNGEKFDVKSNNGMYELWYNSGDGVMHNLASISHYNPERFMKVLERTLPYTQERRDAEDPLKSSRKISSSQKGMENVAEGTKYDDYHIDTTGMGINHVGDIVGVIEDRGNQAVLTIQCSDGTVQHSYFTLKDWKNYKDSKNAQGVAVTDVWVTEVQGGSYVRNSRRTIKSSVSESEPDKALEELEEYNRNRKAEQMLEQSRKINSARYIATDPETGEVLGSADTYEEAVNEWGEDVTITDSETAEGEENMEAGLFSSKKSETTKQTITRLLSSVISGEMTEDEAAEEIAQANDVNVGYAKQIFSEYMNDKERYLTSGMLEIGEALNVDFDPDGNLDTWFVDFAGEEDKPSATFGGELVKAAKLIIRAFRDDGEKIGWGYAMETLNPAARFIIDNTDFGGNDELKSMIDGDVPDDNGYEKWINDFEEDFANYLRDHSELFEKLNKTSFMDAATESDEYTSVDEFFVEDDEGNQYWFQSDSNGWTCVDISYDTTPEYNEGDIITAEDYMFDNIDFNEEFGEFMEAPFEYSWEDGDGESVRISNVRLMNGLYEIDDYISNDELMELVNGTVYDRDGNQLKAKDIF